MIWKDITSYSQRGDRTPRWWQAKMGNLRVAVGNSHIYHSGHDAWWMNCEPWFRAHPLKAKSEQSAKEEAIALVVNELRLALADSGAAAKG